MMRTIIHGGGAMSIQVHGGASRPCWLLVILLLALTWAATALAQAPATYPAPISRTVSDFAGILPPAQRDGLMMRLDRLRTDVGVEMAIVTTDGIPGGPSQLESYATGLFNAWGIGEADRNDGILLLVSPADRAVRLELGRAYGQGYDVLAQDIVSRVLVPALREGQVAGAVTTAVAEIIDRVALPQSEGRAPAPAGQENGWMRYAVPAVMVLGFAGIVFGRRRGRRGAANCPQCGALLGAATGPGTTGGQAACPQCGWVGAMSLPTQGIHDRSNSLEAQERDRRSGGGRDGGFGGGSSSGGGASGRW